MVIEGAALPDSSRIKNIRNRRSQSLFYIK